MDIQSLIRLAQQADLEGNFRVADQLTERMLREAKARWKEIAEKAGKNFGNQSNKSLRDRMLGQPGAGDFSPGAIDARRLNTQKATNSFGDFLSREKDIQPSALPAAMPATTGSGVAPAVAPSRKVSDLRRRLNSGENLTPDEMNLVSRADARNKARSDARAKANATGGNANATGGNVGDIEAEGGAGGAGGHGGSAGAQSNNAVGVGVRNDITTQNQNIMGGASSYSGGNTMIQNVKTPSNWPGVLAGAAAAGGAGYLGYLLGKDGRPVAPAPNARPGDFKANQLSERAQAHQMGNAQAAQNFIESNRGNPKFKSAQDFYYAAQAAGMSQADMNQIAALAKAEGFRDKTPMMN
jgi:hypothetical protein